MEVGLQSVQVAAFEQGGGLLVFNQEWLIAVLVKLSNKHGKLAGRWFLETGYGRFSEREQLVFKDEADIISWFKSNLADLRVNEPWTDHVAKD